MTFRSLIIIFILCIYVSFQIANYVLDKYDSMVYSEITTKGEYTIKGITLIDADKVNTACDEGEIDEW